MIKLQHNPKDCSVCRDVKKGIARNIPHSSPYMETKTELKTLKDLDIELRRGIDMICKPAFAVAGTDYDDRIWLSIQQLISETLKQEARKWVKFLRKEYPLSSELNAGRGAIEFIKFFFNIAEDDLK